MRRHGLLLGALLSIPGQTGCGRALVALEKEGLPGPVAIDGVASALASRFGPIELDAALRAGRPRFARDSLSPSRLLDAPGLWTRRDGSRRWLEFGSAGGIPYRIGVHPLLPPSRTPGSHWGEVRLEAMGDADFEWDVREDLSIGRVAPASLARAGSALLVDLEQQTGNGLRDLARLRLPRASAAFGRLFDLDPVRISTAAGGGVLVAFDVRMDPARIRGTFPRYARFLEEYLAPSRFRLSLADTNGVPFAELASGENRLSLRFRAVAGHLGPLVGPPRAIPDRLLATAALSLKSGIFRVGAEGLVADVSFVSAEGGKGFRAAFSREPDWQLPFGAKPFLRAPLRRPFQGAGALFAMSLRDTPEGATLVEREYRFAVRESWIVRWLGGFGAGMATVFRAGAEAEADRFMGECLWALRDDLVAAATAAASRRPWPRERAQSPSIIRPSPKAASSTDPSSLRGPVAAFRMRPASRERGKDCNHTRPGPWRVAKKSPSPPKSAVFTLPTSWTSYCTDG